MQQVCPPPLQVQGDSRGQVQCSVGVVPHHMDEEDEDMCHMCHIRHHGIDKCDMGVHSGGISAHEHRIV